MYVINSYKEGLFVASAPSCAAAMLLISGCGPQFDYAEDFTPGWRQPRQAESALCEEHRGTMSVTLPTVPQSVPFIASYVVPVETTGLESWNSRVASRPHVYLKAIEPDEEFLWLHHVALMPAGQTRVFALTLFPGIRNWAIDSLFDLSPYMEVGEGGSMKMRVRVNVAGRKPPGKQVISGTIVLWICEPGWDDESEPVLAARKAAPSRT